MTKRDLEIIELGTRHAASGEARYRWQDPYLQALYDRGFDGQRTQSIHIEYMRRMQTAYIRRAQ